MAELRILIADDHELIRRGLRDLLSTQSGWQLVGEASNGIDAVEMAVSLKPDIAILDFSMPGLNGPEIAKQIVEKVPQTGVVVLTMHDSEQVIREVLHAGARGLVLKSDADSDLLAAVEVVAENRHFFASRVAELILREYLTGNTVPAITGKRTVSQLTEREDEVVRLLADGKTSKQVAMQLQISIRTVESHRINISRKLGFSSIADLVRYAIRNGIVAHS
ncbi:MAG: two component transcriptional regulator, LuxR family [Edaphobacter sp.]|nr:two component transcriptional regulator, LuxR family [Edaphobacter sp.]